MKQSKLFAVIGCLALISSAACSVATDGIDGKNGTNGTNGTDGTKGTAGEKGAQGTDGDIACGDTLIPAAVWHTACGSAPVDPSGVVSACVGGIVECRLSDPDGPGGELLPLMMCWDTVGDKAAEVKASDAALFPNNPTVSFDDAGAVVASSARCDRDTTCSGVADKTTGAGTPVALVRTALTYLSPVQSSQDTNGGAQTFLPGLCRNAVEHCLGDATTALRLSTDEDAGTATVRVSCDGYGQPETKWVCAGSEGVVMDDFVADPKESLMGTECVDGSSSVRVYSCVVDAVSGVASVQCAGSIQ